MKPVPSPLRKLNDLRSQRWFQRDDYRGFSHRQRMQQQGLAREAFLGRPVIAIVNTWSELSPCHAHLRERAEAVKRGILQAGGHPVELPALSLGEVMVKPTTMLYRNLLAMETEELLRSLPVDGAVLMGGCDKTTPGLLMGAFSVDLPVVYLPAGPMLDDVVGGQAMGAGTHAKRSYADYRAGVLAPAEWVALESRITRSPGTCNTMGTASTMTAIAEALGLSLPGAMSIPAVDAAHPRMAWYCGQRIVEMVWEDLRPSRIVTPGSVRNAIAVYCALGGSTNAVVHLPAMAHRAGVALSLDTFDEIGRQVPVIADLFPSGQRLMGAFHRAGGLPALMRRIAAHLDLDALTVTGHSMGENLAAAPVGEDDGTLHDLAHPLDKGLAVAVLHGNLAPDGAVIKPSAATPALLQHAGPALVFDSNAEMLAALDDPALDVDESTVLVLRNAGPVGGPGMPEWGNLPLPRKLLQRGVRDMVRLSDARMSGTHEGTCVLHVAPEAAVGGPLALLRTGDRVVLDLAARRIDMQVSEAELAARRAAWRPPAPAYERGYGRIYLREVTQAPQGCDFASLEGAQATPEPAIY